MEHSKKWGFKLSLGDKGQLMPGTFGRALGSLLETPVQNSKVLL